MESHNPSIKKNFMYNIIYQILVLISPLITSPYVARVLSVDAIGKYSFTQSILIYYTLIATLGSGTYGQRAIARLRNDRHKLSVLFYEVFALRCVTTVLALLIYMPLVFTFDSNYRKLFLLWVFAILACAFDITWLYQGIEDFKKTVTRQILIKIIGIVAILIFVNKEADLPIYILCYSLPTFIGNLLLWPGINKIVECVSISELHIFQHIKQEIQLFIPFIATLLFSYVDKTMIGLMTTGNTENGYYEQALKFITIAISVVSAISTVLIPRMAYFFKQSETDKIEEYTLKGIKAIGALSCVLTGGMLTLGGNIIPWFLGSGYDRSVLLLQVLCFVITFKGISNFVGTAILIPSYKQNQYSVGIWISTICNIILNIFLIPLYGAVGASISTVLSEILLFAILIYYIKETLSLRILFRAISKYIIAGTIMTVVVYILSLRVAPSVMNSLMLIILSCGIYGVCLLILQDELATNLLQKARAKLFKRI